VWIGIGKVLATRGRRNAATPVIVRKGALADNVPHHDLRVTKGHAFYVDGVLIPVEFLVNHRLSNGTIARRRWNSITSSLRRMTFWWRTVRRQRATATMAIVGCSATPTRAGACRSGTCAPVLTGELWWMRRGVGCWNVQVRVPVCR